MIIIKIWLHLLANIQKVFFKVVYGDNTHRQECNLAQ